MELYSDPKSLFVASFIGSPQMNLIPCRFVGKSLVSGDLKISGFKDLPKDTDLVMGLRPDFLEVSSKGKLELRVDLVEQHGADNLVYGTLIGAQSEDGGDLEICFKTGHETRPDVDDVLKLNFDPASVFVFDNSSGKRLK